MLNWANFATKIHKPKNFRFESQEEDEEILLLLRRHPITNLKWILISVFLLFLPGLLMALLETLQVNLGNVLSPQQLFLLAGFYFLGVFGYAFEQFLLWYYSVNLVTPKRLVDVDFLGFLNKKVSEVSLDTIQDISLDQRGALAISFNFGTLSVQTEGPEPTVEFEDIPDPADVQKLISKLIAEAKKGATD